MQVDQIFLNIIGYLKQIYNFPFFYSLVIMSGIYICYLLPDFFRKQKRHTRGQKLVMLLYAFYLSQVFGITLLNRTPETDYRYNLNPFAVYQIAFNGNSVFMTQLVANIVMFVPLGIFAPICFPNIRSFLEMALIALTASMVIETLQLLTHTGLYEVVDLINNTAGGLIGYGLYRIGSAIFTSLRSPFAKRD